MGFKFLSISNLSNLSTVGFQLAESAFFVKSDVLTYRLAQLDKFNPTFNLFLLRLYGSGK